MKQATNSIVQKISLLKDQVPSDWAEIISKEMGKSPESIWAYARGHRGIRRGYPLQVLKHLTIIYNKHKQEIDILTKQ